jgi:hypothetical protein
MMFAAQAGALQSKKLVQSPNHADRNGNSTKKSIFLKHIPPLLGLDSHFKTQRLLAQYDTDVSAQNCGLKSLISMHFSLHKEAR